MGAQQRPVSRPRLVGACSDTHPLPLCDYSAPDAHCIGKYGCDSDIDSSVGVVPVWGRRPTCWTSNWRYPGRGSATYPVAHPSSKSFPRDEAPRQDLLSPERPTKYSNSPRCSPNIPFAAAMSSSRESREGVDRGRHRTAVRLP